MNLKSLTAIFKAANLALILAACFSPLHCLSQDTELKSVMKRFNDLSTKYPQEKVYVQFDRPYYAVGDTIWFKAYLVDQRHQLTEHSKVLYVDLIDDRESIIKTQKLSMTAGLGWGSFTLGSDTHEGNYRIRAYTAWMRNFDPAFFFDRVVPIGDTFSGDIVTNAVYKYIADTTVIDVEFRDLTGAPLVGLDLSYTTYHSLKTQKGKGITDERGHWMMKGTSLPERIDFKLFLNTKTTVSKSVFFASTTTDLQFFPEGGQMVNNLQSRVGFKATGSNGLGKNVSGFIKDSMGNVVAAFKSEHAGIGLFYMIPRKGEVYTAVVDSTRQTFQLPKALDMGYVLKINDNAGSIVATVFANGSLVKKQQMTLVVQSNGIIHGTSNIKVDRQVFTLKLSKKSLPSGIIHATLFSEENKPVAERLFFVNNGSDLTISEKFSKRSSAPNEKIDLGLNVKDGEGQPSLGSFSISVLNESKVPYEETKERSIFSELLLTSDMRGYIENPNYYFVDTDPRKEYHLDLLMLTQGWRRFTWREAIDNIEPKITNLPEQGISIKGELRSFLDKPLAGGKVDMLVNTQNRIVKSTTTDTNGKFSFDDLDIVEDASIIFKTTNEKGRPIARIKLDTTMAPPVKPMVNWQDRKQNVNASMIKYLSDNADYLDYLKRIGLLKNTNVLAEVKITTAASKFENSKNLNGPGNADYSIPPETMDEYLNKYSSLSSALASKFPGVNISGEGKAINGRSVSPMAMSINGVIIEDLGIDDIPMMDIESVEILIRPGRTAIYGSQGFGGIIELTTKTGGNRPVNPADNGITTYKATGYATQREFYSPVYTVDSDLTRPDYRTTLYWNPNFFTDKSGKADLSFFAGKEPGVYRFIIEGIDSEGNLGRKVFTRQITSR